METTKEDGGGAGNEERITKEPQRIVREKDPKKVAAGKKLVEYNRKAKQALLEKEAAEKKAAEKDANEEEELEVSEGTWMPEVNFTSVLTMIGLGLTAADLYLRWRKSNPPASPGPNPTPADNTPTPSQGLHAPTPSPAPSRPKPTIGMEGP